MKKTSIQNQNTECGGFRPFFNCLTRRYLWNFDETLMDRIMDRYFSYFSMQTVICSIQDLVDCREAYLEEPVRRFRRKIGCCSVAAGKMLDCCRTGGGHG